MKTRALLALATPVLLLTATACDVDQTEAGEMPDVEVESGELPEYDVDAAEIETGMDTDTIITKHPTVDVDMPDDDGEGGGGGGDR